MKCKEIQQWLMTDYLDGELETSKSAEVENHLRDCAHCKVVLKTVQQTAQVPFKGAQPLQPGPNVWQEIQDKIQAEQERVGWLEQLKSRLVPMLRVPKPVYRVAFALCLIVAVVTIVRWPFGHGVDPAYAYIEEQMVFLDDLQTGNADLLNGDPWDYSAVFSEVQK